MSQKKYVSLSKLQTFLDNLKIKFANVTHTHTISDITDYVVDSELSSTSVNPVQNKVIDAEFEAISQALGVYDAALDDKADVGHTHDFVSYAENQTLSDDQKVIARENIGAKTEDFVANITSSYVAGTGMVYACDKTFEEMWAAHEAGMDIIFESNGGQIKAHDVTPTYISAIDIIKGGNNFIWYHIKSDGTIEGGSTGLITKNNVQRETGTSTAFPISQKAVTDALALKADATHNHDDAYDTKGAADTALASAKSYSDTNLVTAKSYSDSNLATAKSYADSAASTAANTVKNDLLNNAGEAYDTLKELGDLIDDNHDAISALETVAAGKADKVHTHAISDISELQVALDTLTENKSDKTHTHADVTTTASGMMSATDKVKLDNIEERATNGIQRVNMTSEDGAVWTATIDGVEELTNGKTFLFIPNRTSSSTTPTLNVNGLGAVTVRRKMSSGTVTLCAPNTSTLFFANRPTLLMYDTATMNGTPYWIALEFTKPSATDLYGKVPVQNGGWFSNSNTTEDDLVEAREAFGVYSKAEQEMTLIYDSGEIIEAVNSISGINISGYTNIQVAVQNTNDGTNTSSAAGAVVFTAKNGTNYLFHTWQNLFYTTNGNSTSGLAHFKLVNGWLIMEHVATGANQAKKMFTETEGGSAFKCSMFSGGGLIRCTNELSTMAVTSTSQSANNWFGVGSRVMVWGCKV